MIHDISFDDGPSSKMYTEPLTFSKSGTGYTLSFILTDVPEKDIEANRYKEVRPLVNEVLQTADVETVKKYIALLDDWLPNTKYKKNQRIAFNGVPYSIISDHIAQDGQTPDKTPLMYESLLNPRKAESWDEKKTYNKGDLAIARGIVFVSKIDGNKGNEY